MLRYDSENLKKAEDKLKILKNQLLYKDSLNSISFLDSCIENLKAEDHNNKHFEFSRQINELSTSCSYEKSKLLEEINKLKKKRKKFKPKNFPYNLKQGDIICVKFGYGYCNELSNLHYAVVLSKAKGSMYFIVPLSSEPNKYSELYFDNLNLPSKKSTDRSYVVINQARFVHYRRLEQIHNVENGRVFIGDKNLEILNKELNKVLTI